jgi:hypothetical protein
MQALVDRKYNMLNVNSLNKVPALLYATLCACVPTFSRLALGKATVFDDAHSAADKVFECLQFTFLFLFSNFIGLVIISEALSASAMAMAHALWICSCLALCRGDGAFGIRLCTPDDVRAFRSWYKWLYSVYEFESRFHLEAIEVSCFFCVFATLILFGNAVLGREIEAWMGSMFTIGGSILIAMVVVLTRLAKAHSRLTADVAKGLRRQRRANKDELRYLEVHTKMHSPKDGNLRTRDLATANDMIKDLLEELEDDTQPVKLFRVLSVTQPNVNRIAVLLASALTTSALRAVLSRTGVGSETVPEKPAAS